MNKETLKNTAKGYFDKNSKLERIFATESGHFFYDKGDRDRFVSRPQSKEKKVDFLKSDFDAIVYSDLPEDLPGRAALIAYGAENLEDLKGIDDLIEVPGIGEPTAKAIVEYFNTQD